MQWPNLCFSDENSPSAVRGFGQDSANNGPFAAHQGVYQMGDV